MSESGDNMGSTDNVCICSCFQYLCSNELNDIDGMDMTCMLNMKMSVFAEMGVLLASEESGNICQV